MSGSGLKAYQRRLDNTLTPTFGEFSLFIDDARTPVGPDGQPLVPKPTPNGKTAISVTFASYGTRWGVVNVKPVYDDYNNCVEGDADAPGNIDAGNRPFLDLGVTTKGNIFTKCGYEHSRMHWLISTGDGRTAFVQLDSYGYVDATCGPTKRITCERSRGSRETVVLTLS